MRFNLLIIVVAFAGSALTTPFSLTSPRSLLAARDDFEGVGCLNPCAACNLGKTTFADLTTVFLALDTEKLYCIQSDGSKTEDADGNWGLAGHCGINNSAIWLQSYIAGRWCMKGADIRLAVVSINAVCNGPPGGPFYGTAKIDRKDQWVQLGRGVGCYEGNAVPP